MVRRLIVRLVVLLFVLAFCTAPLGTALAEDGPGQVAGTLRSLAATISEMQSLHDLWTAGRVDMGGVILEFSDEQRATLLDRYTTLKGRLVDLLQQLP